MDSNTGEVDLSKQRALGVSWVVAAVMSTGCLPPIESDEGGGTTDAEKFVEQAVASLSEGVCAAAWDCASPSVETLLSGIGRMSSKAECIEAYKGFFGGVGGFSAEFEGMKAGRLEFDPSAASSCQAALDATLTGDACAYDISGSLDESCRRVFVGKVEVGGHCVSGDDCVGDASCSRDGDEECYGTCEVTGTSCGEDTCEEGEYCGFYPSTDTEVCLPKLKAGDTCVYESDCTLESSDVGCLASETGGVCTAYFTVGQGGGCDYDNAFCATGLVCDFDTVTCEPRGGGAGTPSAMNEPCNNQDQPCQLGLACVDIDYASGGSGTCGLLKSTGEECGGSLECEIGLVCKGADLFGSPPTRGACVEPAAEGEACAQDSDCVTFECGDSGMCVSAQVCVVP